MQNLKAIDFFCGAGGMSYGISLADIEVIAGIDIDDECKETYETNNPQSQFIHSDIRTLTFNELEKVGVEKNDDSLVFVGCSPCQHWTRMHTAKDKSKDTKNLLEDFQKFASYFLPGYIVVENVKGLYTQKRKSKLSSFLGFLKKNRYCVDFGVINAAHHGVPQNRKRFLLVASRINKAIKLPVSEDNKTLTVREVIGTSNGFHAINAGHIDDTEFLHTTANLSDKNIKRLQITPHDGGNRLAWKDNPELQIEAYKDKDNTYKDTYGRLYWDKPAPTLTTKFHSISNGRFAHPCEDRGLSLREGATLQTFPKTYIFKGNGILSIASQIGNAVPVELAKKIGLAIQDL